MHYSCWCINYYCNSKKNPILLSQLLSGPSLPRGPSSPACTVHAGFGISHFFVTSLLTLHHELQKNQNCKKRQWCLWRFMCPLSMHQFIEMSICALGKNNSNTSMSSDPWKSVRQQVCPCAPPPKLSGERVSRTDIDLHFATTVPSLRQGKNWKRNLSRIRVPVWAEADCCRHLANPIVRFSVFITE